jgi:hypothetical protein
MHTAAEKRGHVLDITLDVVLARYTGEREVRIELAEELPEIKVKTVLERLSIPPGMVGYTVVDGNLLEPEDIITAPCTVRMFGIYDGG